MARTQIHQSLVPSIANITGYRRPQLTWSSVTTVNTAINSADNTHRIMVFPDGNIRSNDTATHVEYSRMNITRAAVLTGTKLGGLRSGESEATNTWYACYAVKSQDDTATWVIVATTTLPISGTSTLDGYFGANNWTYLGLIRNGDNAAATGDILSFVQSGDTTMLYNTCTPTNFAGNQAGLILADPGATTSLIYTYSAGTGTTQIPNNVGMAWYAGSVNAGASELSALRDGGASVQHLSIVSVSAARHYGRIFIAASLGASVTPAASHPCCIALTGFTDLVLGNGIATIQ
jgi:hypothetical protein